MTRSRDVADTQDNLGGAVAPFVAGKNKIHNGNMAISQKGVGPFSISINSVQTLDRWRASGWSGGTETGVASIEQSTDAPSGFTNSLKLTVTTADTTIASTETYGFLQAIEANNIQSELEYGTATAKALTISFWVKGSVAGTYGAAWQANGAAYGGTGWAYVFSFPVTTSWARVSVTIPGLTTGGIPTFLSTATFGFLRLDIGSGTNYNGTLNAWQTGNIRTFSGATQMMLTSGATLNLTGVQAEFGNVLTPFTTAAGSIGGELALCFRYQQRFLMIGNLAQIGFGQAVTSSIFDIRLPLFTSLRTTANALDVSGLAVYDPIAAVGYTGGTWTIANGDNTGVVVRYTHTSAAFTTGRMMYPYGGAGFIGIGAEL